MKLAVIGVTGLVGQTMLKVLEERNIPIKEFMPVASSASEGREIKFMGKSYRIQNIESCLKKNPHIALFSAGASVSLEWAPRFADRGCFVVDNSSAWRMESGIPLVVPEINAHLLNSKSRIIANPNCSTIQMVVVLNPLHKSFGIKRLVISTYQSFTGTGMKAVNQYESEKAGLPLDGNAAYPHPIFENCLPHCDIFFDNGYTKEELKLVNETRKILDDKNIAITATAVRVPVHGGHSESVNVEFHSSFQDGEIIDILSACDGVVVQNDFKKNKYPMPLFSKDRDEVFVGRIRRDDSVSNGLNLWIVSDNLRKGAATNTVQIAEYLIKNEIVRNTETTEV